MAGQNGDKSTLERHVARIVRGQAASDGAGVQLTRVIGSRALPDLDPFLLLDEFRSDNPNDYIGGFPDHPHRGFETVTYMLAGRMRHGDNQGNTGLLGPGSVQWMTAGKGIVHSEFPEQEEGLMWGFQLWVNLPAKDKLTKPRYQDIQGKDVPEVVTGDWSAASGHTAGRVLAENRDVTAVFCANDDMAIGLIRALAEAGRRVPEDVSVVGFDDIPEAEYLIPPLTTVRQDFTAVGRRAIEVLRRAIQHADADDDTLARLIDPELVVRNSTAPSPGRTA